MPYAGVGREKPSRPSPSLYAAALVITAARIPEPFTFNWLLVVTAVVSYYLINGTPPPSLFKVQPTQPHPGRHYGHPGRIDYN